MAKTRFGRPPKYTLKTFTKEVENYIEHRKLVEKGPITMLDFCCFVGIYKDYISEHNIGDGSELDFSEPIKLLRTEAENSLEYWTLAGKTNPAMAIFSLKNNFGWVDRKEIGGANGGAIQQEFRVIMPEVASPHLLEEAAEDEEIQDLPTVPGQEKV